jgi:hypothetical protein
VTGVGLGGTRGVVEALGLEGGEKHGGRVLVGERTFVGVDDVDD